MDLQRALGEGHPLIAAEGRARTIAANLATAIGAGVAASTLGAIGVLHPRLARASEIASAVVAVLLVIALPLVRSRSREIARDLIASGREDLPVSAVRDERRRLLRRRSRMQLAGTLERIVERAEMRSRAWAHASYADVPSVLATRNDIRAIAALLRRSDSPRAQATAQVHRLITDGPTSPLYAQQPVLLEQELGRILYLLEAA